MNFKSLQQMREPKGAGGEIKKKIISAFDAQHRLFRDKSINPVSDLGFRVGDFSTLPDVDLCPAAREVAVSLTISFWGLLDCLVLLEPQSLCLHVEYFYLLSPSRAAGPKKQQHSSLP